MALLQVARAHDGNRLEVETPEDFERALHVARQRVERDGMDVNQVADATLLQTVVVTLLVTIVVTVSTHTVTTTLDFLILTHDGAGARWLNLKSLSERYFTSPLPLSMRRLNNTTTSTKNEMMYGGRDVLPDAIRIVCSVFWRKPPTERIDLYITATGAGYSELVVMVAPDQWPTLEPLWQKMYGDIKKRMGATAEAPQDSSIQWPEPTGRQGEYSKEDWRKVFEQIEQTGMKLDFVEIARNVARITGKCTSAHAGRMWRKFKDKELLKRSRSLNVVFSPLCWAQNRDIVSSITRQENARLTPDSQSGGVRDG